MDKHIHEEVRIVVDNITLKGELIIPTNAKAIIIFSHGSGSRQLAGSWFEKYLIPVLIK